MRPTSILERFPVPALCIALLSACGGTDAASKTLAIEAALRDKGIVEFPTGRFRASSGISSIGYLRAAEAAGLLTVHEIPQAYWDNFLNSTQGLGTPVEVVASPKLLGLAIDSQTPPDGVIRVRGHTEKVERIVSEEPYTGPLATLGEKYQLVLGVVALNPAPAAAALGPRFMNTGRMRFRCVLKYDAFKSEWSVVAVDMSSFDSEQWFTANVK